MMTDDLKTMTVKVPTAITNMRGFRKVVAIDISNRCPVCGGPRGRVFPALAYDGSIRMEVDRFDNPCGHIDKYENLLKEHEWRLGDELKCPKCGQIEAITMDTVQVCQNCGLVLRGTPSEPPKSCWECANPDRKPWRGNCPKTCIHSLDKDGKPNFPKEGQ
jgi:uncharacterized protein (DUF983 family)